MELARVRNSIPLPKAISGPSIALPPEQDMLVAPNYQIAVQAVKNVDEVEAEDGGASHTPTTSSERNGMPPPSTQQQQQHHHMVDHDNARKVTFSLSGTKRPLS
jgi:transcription initiation factor TFIID subunit 9B